MYVCMPCMYTYHTHTYIYIYIYIFFYLFIYLFVCMYTHASICMRASSLVPAGSKMEAGIWQLAGKELRGFVDYAT